ncbi:MAG: MMCAP2_0565 family pilin-like conjugal transfer protein [Candidatus Falkowbacteria bacterium]
MFMTKKFKSIFHPVKSRFARILPKAKLFHRVKYSLSIIFLSMFLILVPAMADFTPVNQAKAAGWWDTVSQGGLEDVAPAYGQTGTPSANYDIRVMIARIIRIVLELLGIIALVIIIYAGFRWMTAGGDEEKVTTSKKQLTNGLIGLVIILVAFSIATFVLNRLIYMTTGIMPVSWSW